MVELTKKERYTAELVGGLLENRAFLSFIIGSELGSDVVPILDFKLAMKRCKFTDSERRLIDVKYSDKVFCELTYEDIAEQLSVSRPYVTKTSNIIKRKVLAEMNRGLSNV